MRMNAAATSASSAIADCTPLTVVSRSSTTAEIDTFISDVSTTSTNIAIESSSASRLFTGQPSRNAPRATSPATGDGEKPPEDYNRTMATVVAHPTVDERTARGKAARAD